MTFLATPLALTVEEFRVYVSKLSWLKSWRPQFMVLHNTAEPNLSQWSHYGLGHSAAVQRARNLNSYYQHSEGWSSGPQIFVAPDFIIVACDLEAYGVHASCYNRISIGLEMVGDYHPGSLDKFNEGLGAQVRDNAVAALSILHDALKISPDTLHFHRDCTRDHHLCPGLQVDKADMIARVKAWRPSGAPAPAPTHEPPSPAPKPAPAPAPTAPTAQHLVIDGETVGPEQMAVARKVFSFFVGKVVPITLTKLTPAHAAGFVAQAWGESRLVPWLWGDRPKNGAGPYQAYGLFQFHHDDRLANACKALGYPLPSPPAHANQHGANDLTVDQQLDVAWWDLQHPELTHLMAIAKTDTAQHAGEAACTFWERAGAGGAAQRRGRWAEIFLNALK